MRKIFFGLVFVQLFSFAIFSQTKEAKNPATVTLPKVRQVDGVALKNLLKPIGKPLLVNFWATWCDPCREEFPDLVKIDLQYKGKIDFITVSLDDVEEINRAVPKFLAEMKAEMPAYLLKTTNEDAVISSISKDWQGALPFTILYDAEGKIIYSKMGKVKIDVLRTEIEKVLPKAVSAADNPKIENLSLMREIYTYQKGIADAEKDVREGKLQILEYGLVPPTIAGKPDRYTLLRKEYGISISSIGCIVPGGYTEYAKGYNEVSIREIKRRFGDNYLENAAAKLRK